MGRTSAEFAWLGMVSSNWGNLIAPLIRFACGFGAGVGVEQLGESGGVGQVLKVGVIARLIAVCRIEPDGLAQIVERLRKVAGKTIQGGHTIPDEIQLGRFAGQQVEVLAGGYI